MVRFEKLDALKSWLQSLPKREGGEDERAYRARVVASLEAGGFDVSRAGEGDGPPHLLFVWGTGTGATIYAVPQDELDDETLADLKQIDRASFGSYFERDLEREQWGGALRLLALTGQVDDDTLEEVHERVDGRHMPSFDELLAQTSDWENRALESGTELPRIAAVRWARLTT